MSITPTQEQLDIIKIVPTIKKLKIEARAGAAKTTSMSLIAKENPVKSLYITFNKNMGEDAKDKFPPWVDVRTTHSLAYREVGHEYQHKLTRPYGAYKNVLGTGGEIGRYFKLAPMRVGEDKTITVAALGNAVKNTVRNFEFSGDSFLSERHVSFSEVKQHLRNKSFKKAEYVSRVLKFAKKLWEKRVDVCDDTLITHDTYLKLYQLSNPDLSEYEIIYLDEAHDSSPCLLDIIEKQTTKVIVVGDFAQSIYQWRGAVNAMERLNWKTMQLTKSFRFGKDLADIARGIVLDHKMRPCMEIEGYEKKHTEVTDTLPSNITNHICYIYRTNAALLEKALQLLEQGKKVAIHVDVSDFISKIESVNFLRLGKTKSVKHPDIQIYSSWGELVEEAGFVKGELGRIVKMVSSNEHERVLNLLNEYKPVQNPDVMLITAHKSKGLEFDTVVLGDDFEPLYVNEQTNKIEFVNDAERNLLYVACTRAKEMLVINNAVKEILDLNGLWSDNSYIDDVESYGFEIDNIEMVHISPEMKEEGLKYVFDKLSHTEHAMEAQEQIDVFGMDNDEYESSHNVDGTLRLLGDATIQKYEHSDNFYLEKEIN